MVVQSPRIQNTSEPYPENLPNRFGLPIQMALQPNAVQPLLHGQHLPLNKLLHRQSGMRLQRPDQVSDGR